MSNGQCQKELGLDRVVLEAWGIDDKLAFQCKLISILSSNLFLQLYRCKAEIMVRRSKVNYKGVKSQNASALYFDRQSRANNRYSPMLQ